MSYARNLLARGEEVVFESRQHWFAVLAATWLYVVGSLLALTVAFWAGSNQGLPLGSFLEVFALVVLIASLGRIGLRVWGWRNQEYLVTTRRLIKAEGVFNKEMADSGLEKVNDAHLTQSWLGRIFDYGTLDILTAAEESAGIQDYEMLAEPVKFKIAMLNQKEKLERPDLAPPPRMQGSAPIPSLQRAEPLPPRAGSGRVAEVPPRTIGDAAPPIEAPRSMPPVEPVASAPPSQAEQLAATLERLAGLRDRGLITSEEYDAKKRDLLERM